MDKAFSYTESVDRQQRRNRSIIKVRNIFYTAAAIIFFPVTIILILNKKYRLARRFHHWRLAKSYSEDKVRNIFSNVIINSLRSSNVAAITEQHYSLYIHGMWPRTMFLNGLYHMWLTQKERELLEYGMACGGIAHIVKSISFTDLYRAELKARCPEDGTVHEFSIFSKKPIDLEAVKINCYPDITEG